MKPDSKGQPQELGVEIGSKEEAAWKLIRDGAVKELESTLRSIIISKEIIKTAERMIKEEHEKFRKV